MTFVGVYGNGCVLLVIVCRYNDGGFRNISTMLRNIFVTECFQFSAFLREYSQHLYLTCLSHFTIYLFLPNIDYLRYPSDPNRVSYILYINSLLLFTGWQFSLRDVMPFESVVTFLFLCVPLFFCGICVNSVILLSLLFLLVKFQNVIVENTDALTVADFSVAVAVLINFAAAHSH